MNSQSDEGNTPLIEAVCANKIKNCKLLLKNGANLEIKDKGGRTALTHAALYGHAEICNLLLDHGANGTRSIYLSNIIL